MLFLKVTQPQVPNLLSRTSSNHRQSSLLLAPFIATSASYTLVTPQVSTMPNIPATTTHLGSTDTIHISLSQMCRAIEKRYYKDVTMSVLIANSHP